MSRPRCLSALFAVTLAVGTVAPAPGAIVDAAEAGRFDQLARGLAAGESVNAAQADGTTALMWAAYHDDLAAVRQLLTAGAEATAVNAYGVSALYYAALNGNAGMITTLLAAGADANSQRPGGETMLMTAARTGRVEAVKTLLTAGAQVDAALDRGQTALIWATDEGHLATVKVLVAAGADPNLILPSGLSPIFFAVRQGHTELVEYFLSLGVDPNQATEPTGLRGRRPPLNGSSPLIVAIENGHFDLAARLLEAGADPNDLRSGYSPLHTLTWIRKPEIGEDAPGAPLPTGVGRMTSLQLAAALIAHGADVDLRLEKGRRRNKDTGRLALVGNTPFLMACHAGDVPYAKFLVEAGADPFTRNDDGTTALLVAAGLGAHAPEEEAATEPEALELLDWLLSLGLDINVVDDYGETVMHGAAYKNYPLVVQFLYEHGADIAVWNRQNKFGWMPLDIADGYRPGNFKPSAATSDAIKAVMALEGVEPNYDHRVLQNQYD